MAHILSILEEGCTRLFLVGDQGPQGERRFVWASEELEVSTGGGELLWRVPLGVLERLLVEEGRAHWLECRGEQVVLDLVIHLDS